MVPGASVDDHRHLTMSGYDFTCPELSFEYEKRIRNDSFEPSPSATEFLDNSRSSFHVFMASTASSSGIELNLLPKAAVTFARNRIRRRRVNRIIENTDNWLSLQNRHWTKFWNLTQYRRRVEFDIPDSNERYFFYPIHLEPEAVVLYQGHGIYTNQIKLIENIASQLPPNTYLYVKDHPHEPGYRNVEDYLRLKRVPNVRLIPHEYAGKALVKNSIGVVTISGTAGFEAAILGKPVFTFSKTFYSQLPNVFFVEHIKEFREAIYLYQLNEDEIDHAAHCFADAYLQAAHPGITNYFAGREARYGTDLSANAELVAESLAKTVGFLSNRTT